MKFSPIDNYHIEVGTTGVSNGRMLIFRVPDGVDEWDQVGNTRVLVIGGKEARSEIKRLLTDCGRPTLQRKIPDGISSSVHTALREYVGL